MSDQASILDRMRGSLPSFFNGGRRHVNVIRLTGVIGAAAMFRPGLSLRSVADVLDRAFGGKPDAVALVINSPGGSAVQSHLIHQRIRALAEESKTPVLAFIEDVAASGGYMLAAAADEIIADPASIIGSIGVVSAGFGFEKLIEKLGVERRVYTAGASKGMLDPFLPEKAGDVAHLKEMQAAVHRMFIDLVKSRRGEKLQADNPDLFTGAFWDGERARGYGLIDHTGDMRSFLEARFGKNVQLRSIGGRTGLFSRRILGLPSAAAEQRLAAGIIESLNERALWHRFGL